MKLNLASGNHKQEGFLGIDIVKLPNVDIIHDLEKYPWPFEDNSVEEVFCSHYIEHTSDLISFMDEIYRVCKNEAVVKFVAPYYTYRGALADPTHKRLITDATFLYFNKSWRELPEIGVGHYPIKSNFMIENISWKFEEEWEARAEEVRLFALKHYWNVATDIKVNLIAIK